MSKFKCINCGHIYDEGQESKGFMELENDWKCPICFSEKEDFIESEEDREVAPHAPISEEGRFWERESDEFEMYMEDIHEIARTGKTVIEAMRTRKPVISWDTLLIKGAQIAKIPLNEEEQVNTRTVIGPGSKHPLIIETPIYVTHMSFGALSREAKIALARGSASVKTAMCSGEGGILMESLSSSYRYIFEYVPNRYSVTDENIHRVHAIEIKIGQGTKPGMGGHLPGAKVTEEIAEIRGFPAGTDIISPAHFSDITNRDELREKVAWLRKKSEGKPIGIKIAAGNIEQDLEVALFAEPDFITIDGRSGSTGASAKFIKDATSVPTMFALYRAKKYFRDHKVEDVSLVITGGLRVSSDFIKALALGADGVAIGTVALMAIGCQQYRMCHTGKCPAGIATQDPELRARLKIDEAAQGLSNFIRVSTEELKDFARLTGNRDVHHLGISDLCTTSREVERYTEIEHV